MKQLKVEEWDKKALKGEWLVTLKIDGILARMDESGRIVSKNGKPLYNLPDEIIEPGFEFAEIYCGSWEETWSILSASKSPRRRIKPEEIHVIRPAYQPDLHLCRLIDPTTSMITGLLSSVVESGFEGLVLYNREEDRYVKVKPETTVDVKVIGLVASKAKSHKGLLKEFVTEKGKVGIGLTRQQRKEYFDEKYIGTTIEVKLVGGYTRKGMFKSASFVRLRPDK